jgi:hypothetical protein
MRSDSGCISKSGSLSWLRVLQSLIKPKGKGVKEVTKLKGLIIWVLPESNFGCKLSLNGLRSDVYKKGI